MISHITATLMLNTSLNRKHSHCVANIMSYNNEHGLCTLYILTCYIFGSHVSLLFQY